MDLMNYSPFKRFKPEPPDKICMDSTVADESCGVLPAEVVTSVPSVTSYKTDLLVSDMHNKVIYQLWKSQLLSSPPVIGNTPVPSVGGDSVGPLFDPEEVAANTVIFKMTEDPFFPAFKEVFLTSLRQMCCFDLGYPQFRLRGYAWSGGLRISKLRSFSRFLRSIFKGTEFDHPFERLISYANWGVRRSVNPAGDQFLIVDKSEVSKGDIVQLFNRKDVSELFVSYLVTDDSTVLFMWIQYFASYKFDFANDRPVLRDQKLFSPGVLHAILCVS